MRMLLVALALGAAACSPPAAPPPEAPAAEAPPAPVSEFGPYSNAWDSDGLSGFRHTLSAPTPGAHTLTLQATTTSPGGETVAVYPIGSDGARQTTRIMFLIADTDGSSESESVEIPAGGLPVEVIVENASGRRFAGSYTLTVAP
jgi:hypothetical protein